MNIKPLTKLLFVDDDEDILVIAKYCLQELKGVEVKYESSGKAAIQETLQFQPDLILLDVMMPGMDGLATLHAIQQLQTIAHIPVVFFTAKVQKEEITSYHQAGVIDVIVKPFDPLTLGKRVLGIWEKYQKESQ
ncbi:MAG: response regulator [Simkania sp.]|nr:response regulator [Simkania sp.]